MKTFAANLTGAFWGFVYGEIIGYIGSALVGAPYNWIQVGVIGAVVALIAFNGIRLISR
ncbi:YjzD family protein [Fructilactobacillus fructivorans]|uniref:DUF2929 family protein n=1 Tax=Fructilactobacillus fructivorans TaxID=1614 RepID=A0A0C1M0G5_9LACO|nr:YjzD family protein [Fructilactobacillus fructivorans]KID42610.1 hypothetical protein LfDm3_0062 [Fructilactobacillus fructivorans]KRK58686.1 hypothetical protein FC73_GL000241 [Fructilactobacillus fructivorans]KRN13596.1 hypothetical protein IV37_GL000319 [Fructilactobacillus fructivorans]KRN40240.1 hypothetical protein IV51_GL000422 [Fructilactobacillus fructivorans]KRN43427.1 hypothetical protein IV48_GL000032 [Fructilactobacillus fructivorans]